VLIGASGDGRTPETRVHYLTNIATQSAAAQWAWAEKHLFYESDGALGFAAFGEIILTEAEIQLRARFRLTPFCASHSWRLADPSVPRFSTPEHGHQLIWRMVCQGGA